MQEGCEADLEGDEKVIDREKVINGLREMSCRETWQDIDRIRNKFQPIINGAIGLLKEQEAVEPIPYHRSDGTIFKYECRKCRTKIFKNDLFCRHCGQVVKWE